MRYDHIVFQKYWSSWHSYKQWIKAPLNFIQTTSTLVAFILFNLYQSLWYGVITYFDLQFPNNQWCRAIFIYLLVLYVFCKEVSVHPFTHFFMGLLIFWLSFTISKVLVPFNILNTPNIVSSGTSLCAYPIIWMRPYLVLIEQLSLRAHFLSNCLCPILRGKENSSCSLLLFPHSCFFHFHRVAKVTFLSFSTILSLLW